MADQEPSYVGKLPERPRGKVVLLAPAEEKLLRNIIAAPHGLLEIKKLGRGEDLDRAVTGLLAKRFVVKRSLRRDLKMKNLGAGDIKSVMAGDVPEEFLETIEPHQEVKQGRPLYLSLHPEKAESLRRIAAKYSPS